MPKPKRKIIQLDYYTEEPIPGGEYDSIEEAAADNWIDQSAITSAIRRNGGKLPTKKIMFKYKDDNK